jgi:hypothetical protein
LRYKPKKWVNSDEKKDLWVLDDYIFGIEISRWVRVDYLFGSLVGLRVTTYLELSVI